MMLLGIKNKPILLSDRTKTILASLTIILVAVIMLLESLLPDRMLAPLDILMTLPPWSNTEQGLSHSYNALPSDKVLYIHPLKVLTGRLWRQGLPLWAPHLLGGYPLIGNAQAGIFYPFTALYIILSGADASDWTALAHLVIAGLGMFWFLRLLDCRYVPALFGAFVFMLNTVSIGWLMWDSVAGAMVWLPLILCLFESSLRPGKLWLASLGALPVALTYLGGHLQWSIYALLIFILYFLFRLMAPGAIRRRCILRVALLMIIGGSLVASVQLLPTLEYIRLGHRQPQSFEALTAGLDWSAFVTLWVPGFFGDVTQNWWGKLNYNELIVYAGLPTLILTIFALLRRRNALTFFFGLLAIYGAACAAGTSAYWILAWLPGFNSLTPMRMHYLVIVSFSILSALGLDTFTHSDVRRRSTLWLVLGSAGLTVITYALTSRAFWPTQVLQVAFVHLQEVFMYLFLTATTLLMIIASWSHKWRRQAIAGLLLLLLADLALANRSYLHTASIGQYYPATPGIASVQADPDDFRTVSLRRGYFDTQMPANVSLMFGLDAVDGYDSVYERRYKNFLHQLDQTGPPVPESIVLAPSSVNSTLIDLLNVKYVFAPDDWIGPGWTRFYDAEMRIYRRIEPWPRAWLAKEAETWPTAEAVLQRLVMPGFNPETTVLLEELSPILSVDGTGPIGTVRFDQYQPSHLTLTANMARSGWLVLSENYHPGWTVRVDGHTSKLYQADYLFRAVPLTSGTHYVELSFEPVSFILGAIVSVVTLASLLLMGIVTWKLHQFHT